MNDPMQKELYNFMLQRSVDPTTAREAARNCSRAMERSFLAGASIGFTVAVVTQNPSALLMGAFAGAGGSVMALGWSPSCAEVRRAADFWSDYEGIR